MPEKRFVADPSPWMPIADPLALKVLGKFAEELFECAEVAADLNSSNAQLANEIADVLCNRRLVAEFFDVELVRAEVTGTREAVDEYDLICSLGRCGAAVSRCIIQGIDGAEPSTGRVNRDWLIEEMCGLGRIVDAFVADFDLEAAKIKHRMEFKREHLLRWHQMKGD